MIPKRSIATLAVAITSMAAAAPAALAFDCGNASKPVGPGEKAVVSEDGVVSISKSWQEQLAHGKTVDELHGGYLGIDLNGDGVADADTYADPHGEIPEQAQTRGADCHGVVTIEAEIACRS
jgi:hypothetical protein